MITTRFTALGLLALLSVPSLAACSGDDETSVGAPLDADAIENLEMLADRVVAAGVPGVSVAVLQGDQTVVIARGVADLATEEPLSPDHRFRVASIAKSVLASVVLQLVEEGRLAMTDTVEQWLPGILPANAHASIENLMRLESGIFNFRDDDRLMAPYFAGDLEFNWAPRELVALAADHPPLFAPGTAFSYSNTNYVLLALIIEKITGDSLANVVRERITEPLEMSSSVMATGSALESPYAHGYFVGATDEPMDVTRISASSAFGNGNLVATPLDIVKFYRALIDGEVVSEGQLQAMLTKNPEVSETRYATGLWRLEEDPYPCGTFIGHDGALPGYDGTGYTSLDGARQFSVFANSLTLESTVGDARAQQAFMELMMAVACN